MDSLIATAASGMRSRMETLDLLANNIANSSTAGYKADQESYNTYFGDQAWDGYNSGRPDGEEMPVVQRSWADLSQGTLLPTGNSSDVALASGGMFTVDGPGGTLYTRNGHFRVARSGALETQDGYAVKGSDGKPIKLSPNSDFQIDRGGAVSQHGAAVGQLAVVNSSKPDSAERVGAGYFRFPKDVTLAPSTDADVQQGKVESSNVTPAFTAVKLVSVMRSFEMLQKAVTMANDMNRRAIDEVAKVS